MNNYTVIDTPLGAMTAASLKDGICFFDFSLKENRVNTGGYLERTFGTGFSEGTNRYLISLKHQAEEYFGGRIKSFSLPLVFTGTPFQEKVWKGLLEIPYGRTISYKELAVKLGGAEKVRAVANANGSNRIAVIVPCHRDIGSDGTLTGYGGGLWRKKWLIEHEKKYLF